MSKIKVAVFGVGCVGSEVVKQLQAYNNIEICGVFSRTYKPAFANLKWFLQWQDLVDQCDVIVETIGGIEIAREIVFYSLARGKTVVTANKYLLATYGQYLLPHYQKQLFFEASVCGAIPIIKLMNGYFKQDNILQLEGILNGTSNYILTQMERGDNFLNALKKAQNLGFAESNPSFDIDGIDASHKAAILHYLAFGFWIDAGKITIEKPSDAKAGQKNIAKITKGEISIKNRQDDTFCTVDLNKNAIMLNCVNSGKTFISGLGAGGKETAFAVISDIVN